LNNLCCANDTIIFAATDKRSLQLIMRGLRKYEEQSGQLINKDKKSYYVYSKATQTFKQLVEEVIDISRGIFPLMYLDFPIGHAKKQKVHCSMLIKKNSKQATYMERKVIVWRDKVVLINSVL